MSPDVQAAERFAARAHGDQRYGDGPYTVHLAEVVSILREVGVRDPELLAAGWLHDVVEDTPIELSEVREAFGERVGELVAAVTDDEGATRSERKAGAYLRIAATPGAQLVKLADRLANVRSCVRDLARPERRARGARKIRVYLAEQEGLRDAIKRELPDEVERALWELLDATLASGADA